MTDYVVMKEKETGKSRGFGFVTYKYTDSVNRVMAEKDQHMLIGKWIDCKMAYINYH